MWGLGSGGVRRDTDLLNPQRLTANITQRLLLAGFGAKPFVQRATVRIPEHMPEGHTIRLRPESGFTGEAVHLQLLVQILKRQLLRLRLPLVVRVVGGRRDGKPRSLIHDDLQPLIQRLVHHVVHNTGRVTGAGWLPPRA